MQFEKIRTINKRKIIIGGLISLGVISAGILATSRAKYRTTESFNIVNGTINYRVPDLNLVAMYTVDEENNEESISTIPTDDGNYTYTLNTSKSVCTVNEEKISSIIELENGLLNFKGLSQKGTKCSVYFDKVKVPEKTTSEQTLANLGITNPKEPAENMFANTATTDEGVFKAADPMYGEEAYSYYYRGAVTNNYVKFANFCWRIIRINGDGTIRMIYDGTTCHNNGTSTAESIAKTSQKYSSGYTKSHYVGYTWEAQQRPTDNATANASNLKVQTDSWLGANITGTNAEKVAEGLFCNDRNTASGYTWEEAPSSSFFYAARGRLESAKTPTLACDTGDIYILKAGAITADEVSFAGGVFNTTNNKYYLYNGQTYWTMSPSQWCYDSFNRFANIFTVYYSGALSSDWTNTTLGVRPVINLRADTIFSSGNGTIDTPFTVQ